MPQKTVYIANLRLVLNADPDSHTPTSPDILQEALQRAFNHSTAKEALNEALHPLALVRQAHVENMEVRHRFHANLCLIAERGEDEIEAGRTVLKHVLSEGADLTHEILDRAFEPRDEVMAYHTFRLVLDVAGETRSDAYFALRYVLSDVRVDTYDLADDEAGPSPLRAATFRLDDVLGDQSFPGWTLGETWNGWACPYFSLEVAAQIAEQLCASGTEETWTLDEESGTLYSFEPDAAGPDAEGGDVSIWEPTTLHGERVIALGSGLWIWSEVLNVDEEPNDGAGGGS